MSGLKVWSENENSTVMEWKANNGDSVAHYDVADRLTAMEAEIGYQKSLVAGLRAELAAANPDAARLRWLVGQTQWGLYQVNRPMPGIADACREAIDALAGSEATWLS